MRKAVKWQENRIGVVVDVCCIEVITDALKVDEKKKTQDKKAAENEVQEEKPKGDPPVIEGQLEDVVRQRYVHSKAINIMFFSRPRSESWPHHGRIFSIDLCPLSF